MAIDSLKEKRKSCHETQKNVHSASGSAKQKAERFCKDLQARVDHPEQAWKVFVANAMGGRDSTQSNANAATGRPSAKSAMRSATTVMKSLTRLKETSNASDGTFRMALGAVNGTSAAHTTMPRMRSCDSTILTATLTMSIEPSAGSCGTIVRR